MSRRFGGRLRVLHVAHYNVIFHGAALGLEFAKLHSVSFLLAPLGAIDIDEHLRFPSHLRMRPFSTTV